jgi:hypothetical protein
MRFVTETEPGVIELTWTWLPTFIGMHTAMKKEIEAKVSPLLVGKGATDEVLDAAHDKVIEIICEKFQLPGLKDYLEAIKFVDG